jgi:hypothetical protein
MPPPARLVALCDRIARQTTAPVLCPRTILVPPATVILGIECDGAALPRGGRHYYELEMTYGSPSSGVRKPQTHTPRRFFHFGLAGGRFTNGEVAFDYRLGNSGERSARRIGPAALGGVHGNLWMGRLWPAGGIWGGHLMFIWHRGPYRYLATLHTWRPLSQPRRVLARIVASLRITERFG